MPSRKELVVFGALAALALVYNQRDRIVGWFTHATTAAVTAESAHAMSPQKVEKELQTAETRLPEIFRLIEAGDVQGARQTYDQIFGRLERLRAANSDPTLPRGRSLGAEIARHQQQLAEQIAGLLRREIDSARTAPDNVVIPRLLRRFARVGPHDIGALHAAEAPALDRTRRLQAHRWIRVLVTGDTAEFGSDALESVVGRVKAPPGYVVVRGPATGPLEEAATFCTLAIDLRPQIQNYVEIRASAAGEERFYDYGTAQGLLKELVLTIKPGTLSRNYPNTWAALSDQDLSIRIDLDTPREITVPANGSPEEFFLAQNRDRIARVRKALAPRIAELPLFDFTPADEPAPLSRPQALFATERFVSTLREARARQTDPADAWLIVAELQVEALAPDLEKRLPGLPPEDQHRVIQRLAAHPWFGAHGPLLQLVRKSSPEVFMATLRSLAPELGDVAVRQTILERFRQERFAPAFTRHLALLAESCPASESAALGSFYPELPQEIRGPFVSGLMLSNRAAANTLAHRRLAAGADARETADLASGMASALGRIYSARKLDLNDEERRFFLGAVATLVGKNRVSILENLPRSESLWSALLAAPRADWSPAEQLALLEHAQQLASPEEKPAAIHEICRLFASGSFAERQLELRADHVLGNLSNSLLGARSHQPAHVPILVWLLDQPANSPHARRFGRTAIHLMSGVRMPGLLADPQARALLESARRSPDSSISGKAAELIKAAAERDPSYRDLL